MLIEKKLIQHNHSSDNNPIAIVIHETDNFSSGSDADAHYRYWNSRNQGSSAHYVVDDKKVIKLVEHHNQSWHNGKSYGNATRSEINNSNSIGIEMCVNAGSDYGKVLKNTIQLVKMLMVDLNIGIDNVLRHYDTKKKYCPRKILDTNRWEWFKEEVKRMDVPQWQVAAFKNMVDKLNLDKEYWTEDKASELITKGELFAVLEKFVKNIKIEVRL